MKRLVVLAVMAAFILGFAGMAKAAELKVSGDLQSSGNYVTNPNFDKDYKDDAFHAYQRFRITFEFIANENLKAVTRLHYGDARMGAEGDRTGGLDIGSRYNVQWDRAYLDFMVPNTQVNLKMGLQPVTLPGNLGSHILDDNVWGLTGSAPINDMVAVTLGWARLQDDVTSGPAAGRAGESSKDEIDMFFALLPVTLDGFQFTPFAAYARAEKNAFELAVADPKSSNHYWFGVSASMDLFDPIVVLADFNYGGNTRLGNDVAGDKVGATAGWIAALAVQYNMDMFTPMIFGMYESGHSKDSADNGKTGRVMPSLGGDLWGVSSFGFSGSNFRHNAIGQLSLDGAMNQALGLPAGTIEGNAMPYAATGKWALGFKLKDITFIDKMTHTFNVAYYRGTNHKDNTALFTTEDSAWEVNFDTQYQLYEELVAVLELGYLSVNLKKDSDFEAATGFKRNKILDDDSFKAALGLRYRF